MLSARTFRCMTTDIELFLVNDDEETARQALCRVEDFFNSVEARFSRFLPDSELSRLNETAAARRAAGVPVSADLAQLIGLAVDQARVSGGVFDPTILEALETAGYDRSIDVIREQGTTVRPLPPRRTYGRWADLRVERRGQESWVRLPERVRIDLGGIGKGWAADRAAAMLRPLGAGLVSAGGDARAWGDDPAWVENGRSGPEACGWVVAVDHPTKPGGDVAWLRICDEAVATSSIAGRQWSGGHHLIDPRTGRPADTDLISVSVVGSSVTQAEVAAKVVLIMGQAAGLDWLARQNGLEALLACRDGQFVATPGLSRVLV